MTETKKFVPTDVEKKIIAALSKEQKAILEKTDDSVKSDLVLAFETQILSSKINVETEEVQTNELEESYPILIPGETLLAGMKIKLRYQGYVPMFSKTQKTNWEKDVDPNGQVYYKSGHYRFEREDGSTVGIFEMGGLHILKKLPTNASNKKVKTNPLVAIDYIGLLTKQEAEEKHGMKIEKGDKMHVFKVGIEKSCTYDKYAKGIINYLKAPYPKWEAEKANPATVALNNWEALQAANEMNVGQLNHTEQKLIG